jgi:pimeloyl-ACP methyl ester carboxylesterase
MTAPTTTATAHTIDAPGVTLYYEVRGAGPLLMIVGSPREAAFFAPLADALADTFTVVTTDPRGIAHSVLDDPDRDSTPTDRAADLHRVLITLDRGPAHVFGSSGGAVTAIALAERYPRDVRAVVAHEPPLPMLLEDRDDLLARADDIRDTFLREVLAG